ncbi:MAG: hypothetical protein ACI9JM_001628 [Halioglobus sp.]|jgi:hypothetical protein
MDNTFPRTTRYAVTVPSVALSLKPFIMFFVFMAIFAGCQGGRYYMANRLQELGIACSLALFVLGAWQALFILKSEEWRAWVLRPLLLIFGIMLISSIVFTVNYNGNVMYSFFSAREFMLAFSGPGIYLLVRCGFPLANVERMVWAAIVALMINYLFFYSTMNLRETFFSPDNTVSSLVTYDPWRGFRLKPPLFAIMVGLLSALMLLCQARGLLKVLAAITVMGLASYIWTIVMFRSTLATMILSLLLYPIFLSNRNRLPALIVLAPLVLLILPLGITTVVDHFLNADGGGIRAKAFVLAFEHIPRHFFLGAGEDSTYGQSYPDIVAYFFYPSDLGLVGTFYKYGLVGCCLYLGMHFKIWRTLWRANLAHTARYKTHNALVWGLFMFMTAQSFNIILNPGLAYAQGITLGSLALCLASLQLIRIEQEKAKIIA